MLALIVHNSDEIKDVFVGDNEEKLLNKIKESEYWEDITYRLSEMTDDEVSEEDITIDSIIELHHDGDSEDGYTVTTCK